LLTSGIDIWRFGIVLKLPYFRFESRSFTNVIVMLGLGAIAKYACTLGNSKCSTRDVFLNVIHIVPEFRDETDRAKVGRVTRTHCRERIQLASRRVRISTEAI
jgi:hypothetical protein